MNILAVFAHPDDEVLGAGGTIARYAEDGHRVLVQLITPGRSDPPAWHDNDSEVCNAFGALGYAGVKCFELADQQLDAIALKRISQLLEAQQGLYHWQPDLLITHYLHDLNRDHQLTARAALTAFRDCPRVLMSRPIPYALQGHPFEPNFWVGLHADHVRAAKQALACYKSEAREYPHWRSLEAFERRFYELPNHLAHEPFMAVRWVEQYNQSVAPSDRN